MLQTASRPYTLGPSVQRAGDLIFDEERKEECNECADVKERFRRCFRTNNLQPESIQEREPLRLKFQMQLRYINVSERNIKIESINNREILRFRDMDRELFLEKVLKHSNELQRSKLVVLLPKHAHDVDIKRQLDNVISHQGQLFETAEEIEAQKNDSLMNQIKSHYIIIFGEEYGLECFQYFAFIKYQLFEGNYNINLSSELPTRQVIEFVDCVSANCKISSYSGLVCPYREESANTRDKYKKQHGKMKKG